MKYCTKCFKHKDLTLFYLKTKGTSRPECKVCTDKANSEYYFENRAAIVAYKAAYGKANRVKGNERTKAWSKANPGVKAARTALRRAVKLSATPKWLSTEQKREIKQFYLDAKELQWLNDPTDPLQVDHIIPLQGENVSGLHVPWNLQILPRSLNLKKHNNV